MHASSIMSPMNLLTILLNLILLSMELNRVVTGPKVVMTNKYLMLHYITLHCLTLRYITE